MAHGVNRGSKASRGFKVSRAYKEFKVSRVSRAFKGSKGFKVYLVPTVSKGQLALLVRMVKTGKMVRTASGYPLQR